MLSAVTWTNLQSNEIVLARQNSRDFVSSKLEAVSPAVTKLGVFMGFNEGDGSGFEGMTH